ncbi:MAG TPA: transglutaminase domain-containing protein [Candidatus Acidoferrales bacterium]|nr:transglutaminase domain-containing protein [Candidatus Acidoferrales bacterium]
MRAVPDANPDVRDGTWDRVRARERGGRHTLFRVVWIVTSALLLLAIAAAAYSVLWEYSTRRYVRGFSDAIVPAVATPEQKIDAILRWMSDGPARLQYGPDGSIRDPTETLNYASLLKVCGTATNAFVNLADSAGLSSRRLLLLGPDRMATHVVAEVLVDGRWIVVDPAFRTVLRDSAGNTVTRKQLSDRSVFLAATHAIAGYDPAYTYDQTVHIRMGRLGGLGAYLRLAANRLAPGWEDSVTASLLLERESLATMVGAMLLLMILVLARVFLRWYGARRLGIHPPEMGARMLRAWGAFFDSGTAL